MQLKEALRIIKQAAELSGPPVIYLHGDDGQPFGMLVLEPPKNQPRPLLDAAEDGMVKAGWNIMNHGHLEGEDEEDLPPRPTSDQLDDLPGGIG